MNRHLALLSHKNIKDRKEDIKVKKPIFCTIMIVLLCFSLTGCGRNKETTVKQIDMDKLQETMLAADETLPKMQVSTSKDENADLNFSSLSDMDYNYIADYFYAYAKTGTPQEIVVIQLKDSKYEATLMQSLEKHVDSRIKTLQEYNPEQVTMAENAVITRKSGCVSLIISEKNGLVQNAFENFFKE